MATKEKSFNHLCETLVGISLLAVAEFAIPAIIIGGVIYAGLELAQNPDE